MLKIDWKRVRRNVWKAKYDGEFADNWTDFARESWRLLEREVNRQLAAQQRKRKKRSGK